MSEKTNSEVENAEESSQSFRRRALTAGAVFWIMVLVIYSGSTGKFGSLGRAQLNGMEDTEMELINRKERIARGEYAPPPPEKVRLLYIYIINIFDSVKLKSLCLYRRATSR